MTFITGALNLSKTTFVTLTNPSMNVVYCWQVPHTRM